jgi:cobalamin biosynthesis protein CobT
MIHYLSNSEAMDIIDAWGPDPALWPRADRPALEDLLKTDNDFADYVADVKRIEDMLANWEEADDGANINWDDLEDEDEDDADEERDQDDGSDEEEEGEQEPDQDGAPPPPPSSGSDDVHWNDDEDQEDEEEPEPEFGPAPAAEPQEDDDTVIELDPANLKDMDDMFSDFIQKQIEDQPAGEFRVFTRDYDEIVDINAPASTPLDKIDQAVALSTGALAKELRRLIAAQSQVKRIPGKRSGRLHAPNLHRVLSGDDRVFTRREEAQSLDTAISLVLDCSGSMMGERMKLSAEAAYALGCVLHRLNVTFECLGFTDNGSDPRVNTPSYAAEVAAAHAIAPIVRSVPIIMPKFKTFEERWTQPVQRRFAHVYNHDGGYYGGGGVVPFGSTPEGCGVQFAARRLLARKEKRKIMIVMTDGEPMGQNYAGWGAGRPYTQQARETVKSVSAAGIDLIGIGIQHTGPKGYYPNSMVINNLSEMPKQLMDLLKKFMLGK